MIEIDPLSYYFKDIANNKILSMKEEKNLIGIFRNGDKDASRRARDKLINANLRFVVGVAKKYQGQGIELADLICVGNQGLLRSLKYFDENKNFKLISYAVWWIRQQILFTMARYSRAVRIPLHSVLLINKIRKAHNKLEQSCQGHVTAEDIAKEIKKPTKIIEKFKLIDTPAVSLNTRIFEDVELLDTIPSTNENPEDRGFKRAIETLIGSLKKEREQDVIRMYYGIGYDNSHTLDQIGERYSISRERVRQIKTVALKHLEVFSRALKKKGVL